jgi:dTDP-4-dehydrorhamnose 3,5-epimerase
VYKCTDIYSPVHERTLAWNDATVGIQWPLPPGVSPNLSSKDATGRSFAAIEKFS